MVGGDTLRKASDEDLKDQAGQGGSPLENNEALDSLEPGEHQHLELEMNREPVQWTKLWNNVVVSAIPH